MNAKPTFVFNDSLSHELEYVRDQMYKDSVFFCFGHKDLQQKQFEQVALNFIQGYNFKNVLKIELLGKGKNICFNETISKADVKGVLLGYLDDDDNFWMDYINFKTGIKEKHRASAMYASVSKYFLFKKTSVTNKPSLIDFRNKSFETSRTINTISKASDPFFKEAHAK